MGQWTRVHLPPLSGARERQAEGQRPRPPQRDGRGCQANSDARAAEVPPGSRVEAVSHDGEGGDREAAIKLAAARGRLVARFVSARSTAYGLVTQQLTDEQREGLQELRERDLKGEAKEERSGGGRADADGKRLKKRDHKRRARRAKSHAHICPVNLLGVEEWASSLRSWVEGMRLPP